MHTLFCIIHINTQAQGVVETEEMRAVGIKVEMGPTGKLQVTREDDKDA